MSRPAAPDVPGADPAALLEYVLVDVFALPGPDGAAVPFTGNPLAVVLGAGELSTPQCQALAAEFNLSETAFPTAPTAADADYRVRIFTPGGELPFAGHPSIGTAWTLASRGDLAAGARRQECGAGLVDVDVPAVSTASGGNGPVGDPVRLTGPLPTAMSATSATALLAAVGLTADDAAPADPTTGRAAAPAIGGSGIPFAFLPLRTGALARCRPVAAAITSIAPAVTGVLAFETDPGGSGALQVRARMFAADIGEDPATGSAALGLGGWLVHAGLIAGDGVHRYDITQGVELGRPSLLTADVTVSGGDVTRVRVSGRVVAVGAGRIRIPRDVPHAITHG